MKQVLRKQPDPVVVVDEAYVDLVQETAIQSLCRYRICW